MEHKKINEYLPEFIQEYREIKEVMNSEQVELDELWVAQTNTLNNSFVMDADEAGVTRYEKMLGIVKKPTESLEDRKFNIIVQINEQLPYTMTALNNKLENLCGADGYVITLSSAIYTIAIKVALTAKNNFYAVQEMVKRILPCNLIYTVSIIYNQHETLAAFTHGQLAVYTHSDIRNEVLTSGN